MFLGLSWTGEGNARKRRDERRHYIDFAAVSASRAACASLRRFVKAAFRASTSERSALGALALAFASQIVTPPFGGALACDVRLGGENALSIEHVHEALIIERPRRHDPLPVIMVINEMKVVHAKPLAALPADARDPVPFYVLYDRPAPRPAPLPGEAVVVAVDAPELGYGRLVAAPRRQCVGGRPPPVVIRVAAPAVRERR